MENIDLLSMAVTIFLGLVAIALTVYFGMKGSPKNVLRESLDIKKKATDIQKKVDKIWDLTAGLPIRVSKQPEFLDKEKDITSELPALRENTKPITEVKDEVSVGRLIGASKQPKFVNKEKNSLAYFRIVIIHSISDRIFIGKLCNLLERSGLGNLFLAESPTEFKPSMFLPKIIRDEIDRCQCIIVVFTIRSLSSPWVNQEIGYAFSAGKELVMIVEEGLSVPALVSANQYARFHGEGISDDIRKKVIPYLRQLKKRVEAAK